MDKATQDRIHKMVTSYPVMLFMKGTPDEPRCGFSATVAGDPDVPGRALRLLRCARRSRRCAGIKELRQLAHHPAALHQR
ncbi:MAG: hypothetical protein R3F43_27840 [bacterium]